MDDPTITAKPPGRAMVTAAGDAMPAPSIAATIEVRGLSKSFGAVRAVDNLTFSVAPGPVTGLLGRNSAASPPRCGCCRG